MVDTISPGGGGDAVRQQAADWVLRLASGQATAADAEALHRWRDQSAAHRQAFAEAKLLWETLGSAATAVVSRTVPAGHALAPPMVAPRRVGRRAVLGGALAASVATMGYLGARPPFQLWPSFGELQADYRTAAGEQRNVALADDVSLVLNTRTSIGVESSAGAKIVELIAGEASFNARAGERTRLDVVAAGGHAMANMARFDMRRDGATVCVTCLDGTVDIGAHGRSLTLSAGHQATYDDSGLRGATAVDIAAVTAWQQGQLVFRHEPLTRVVAEVNRYRRGRIVLLNDKLGERDVVATFRLDRIDDAVEHLARAFNAQTRYLPGGVVVLS
ncbi:MAG: FecR domain-containing protein [Pseudomonadota bacterium]